jgi:hypothetical protein
MNELTKQDFLDLDCKLITESDDGNEFTFNTPSLMERWVYCIVWNKLTGYVTVTEHPISLGKFLKVVSNINELSEILWQVCREEVSCKSELEQILSHHAII